MWCVKFGQIWKHEIDYTVYSIIVPTESICSHSKHHCCIHSSFRNNVVFQRDKSPSKQHLYYPLCSWALQSWHTHFVLLNISMAAATARLQPDLSVNIALYCTAAWTDRALLCCSMWEMAACPGWWAEQRKRKKNNSLLLRNRSVPLNKLTLWHFKLLSFWFLRCWMQEELFIKHTRVVPWQQKSLSDFLGTLSVEMKSQTMQHSGQKKSAYSFNCST